MLLVAPSVIPPRLDIAASTFSSPSLTIRFKGDECNTMIFGLRKRFLLQNGIQIK